MLHCTHKQQFELCIYMNNTIMIMIMIMIMIKEKAEKLITSLC